tara:strand:+ start:1146 stop:3644 length:2499 start_codon:yes stop_codon:yes gene_type:complete
MTNITTFPGDCFNLGFVNKKSYTFNPTGNTSKYFIGASYQEGMEIEIDDIGHSHGGNQRFYITRQWGGVPALSTADVSTNKVYNFYYTEKHDRLYVWFNETLNSQGNNVTYTVRVKTIQAALGPEPAADEQYGDTVIGVNNAAAFPAPTIIKRNNQVGIGTATPQDVTHIYKEDGNNSSGLLIEQNNGGTGSATLKFGAAHTTESTAGLSKAGIFFKRAASNGRGDLLFCMDNADDTNDVDTSNHALTIYRDGNVGIGTTAPDKPLHVFSASGAGNTQLHLESGDRYASIQMLDTGGGVVFQNDQGDFRFITGYNTDMQSGTEAVRIDGNQDMHLNGSLFLPNQNDLINFTSTGQSTGLRWGTVGGSTVSKIIDHGNLNICTDDNMSFRIGNIDGTNLPTEYLNIDSDGLTMSAGELNVRGGSDTTHYLGRARIGYIGHSNYAGFAHHQRGNSGDYAMIHESAGTTYINCSAGNDINFRCANSDKCIMKNTGRWGFGTTQPLAPVDVANSVGGTVEINNNQILQVLTWSGQNAQNNDANGVNVSVNGDGGNITAHGFYAGYAIQFQSDRRIKKDIVEVQDDVALQKFRLLKPSKYKYVEPILSGRSQRDVFGFIAQEVQEVMPEAVTEGIVDGTCQGHIPNIMTLCTVDEQHITPEAYNNLTTEQKAEYFYSDQNEVDVGEELANSYIREVITFSNTFDLSVITDNSYTASTTTKTTGDFEQDPETGEYWPVIFYDKNKVTSKKSIIKIIDSSSFIVDERLNTDTLIDGTELLCYGQQPGDFVRLNKDAIFTVTAAALQEVDRQQLSDKVRIATLESQYSNLLSRVTVLENA